MQGLEAGADDFLTKPVDDIALITRVKNLARLKTLNDEMLLRMATGAEIGVLPGGVCGALGTETARAACCWWRTRTGSPSACAAVLAKSHEVDIEPDPQTALLRLADKPYDVVIVSLNLAEADGLRLCSQVRALERTRHLPIIVLAQPGEEARLLRALDMGVNDYLTRPIDRNELLARVRTQIKRKRHSDHLRDRLEESVELALTDALTGLHNRRYMETHLKALAEQARERPAGRSRCCLPTSTTSSRSTIPTATTPGTTCCASSPSACAATCATSTSSARVGGEEFVIVMPDTGMERALQVGERLRACDCRRAVPGQQRNAPCG